MNKGQVTLVTHCECAIIDFLSIMIHLNLSTSICVQCTAKLWKGEIVNRNNEFERYDKLAFINL